MTEFPRSLDVDLEVLAATEPCECATTPAEWDRGWDAEHKGNNRPILEVDYIYCPTHGDVGHDRSHGRCKVCKGSGRVPSKLWLPWTPTTCEEPGCYIGTCFNKRCVGGLVVPQVGDVINWTVREIFTRFQGGTWTDIDIYAADRPTIDADRVWKAYHPDDRRLRSVARSTVHQTVPVVDPADIGDSNRHMGARYFYQGTFALDTQTHLWLVEYAASNTDFSHLLDGPWAELWVQGNVGCLISTEVER
jgi:hypothetical protein